jgi:cryptochrome
MFYRIYSPVAFPQKWDKDGAFVRRYVPELEKFPTKYIYEPWKAPIQDQKKAGCLITNAVQSATTTGGDELKTYPKPIFDFATRRTICLDGMKEAYKVNLYGDDPRVLDGTWRQLFKDSGEGATEGNSAADADRIPARNRVPMKKDDVARGDTNGAEEEDESGAADRGGQNRGGDEQASRETRANKRKPAAGQQTLDGMMAKRVRR